MSYYVIINKDGKYVSLEWDYTYEEFIVFLHDDIDPTTKGMLYDSKILAIKDYMDFKNNIYNYDTHFVNTNVEFIGIMEVEPKFKMNGLIEI